MFVAFFDDTGHKGQKIRALAGYAAPEEVWGEVNAEWAQLVSDPKVRYFKAHDCVTGDGLYRNVPRDVRMEVYEKALGIICRHPLVGIAHAVSNKDFKGDSGTYFFRAHQIVGPLDLSARLALLHLGQHVTGRPLSPERAKALERTYEQTWIFCENGTEADNLTIFHAYYRVLAMPQYPHLKEIFTDPPAFREKERYYGLQVADVLAFEAGYEFARRLHPGAHNSRPEWKQLENHAKQHGGALYPVVRGKPFLQ
jgi:hypothetical protein